MERPNLHEIYTFLDTFLSVCLEGLGSRFSSNTRDYKIDMTREADGTTIIKICWKTNPAKILISELEKGG